MRINAILSAISLAVVSTLSARQAHAQFGGGGSLSGQLSGQQQYNAQYGTQPRPAQAQPSVTPPWAQSGAVQTLWVRPGNGPAVVMHSALASAAVPGGSLGPGCRGAFPAMPQQQVWVGANASVVDVLVRAAGPATLAIRAPTGAVFCTDNFGGTDAHLTMRSVVAGTYLVYVGTTGSPVPYTIGASAVEPLSQANVPLPATTTQAAPWQVQIAPAQNTAQVTQRSTTAQPNTAPVLAAITVNGAVDTALPTTTVAPNTTPAGWVRVDPNSAQQPATIAQGTSGAGAPNARGAIDLSPTSANTQQSSGTSTGRAALRFLGRSCLGFAERSPTTSFTVRPGVPFMRVFLRSTGDTTMALRSPDGHIICVDDTFGAHPGADIQQPVAGEWKVHVGTYAPRVTLPYELTVTTRNDVRPDGAPLAAP